jgi:hypothetical protein
MSNTLKEQLKKNNFNIKEIFSDVLLVENFLSEKEISEIFSIINKTTEESWSIEYHANLKNFCMEKFGRDDVENLIKEGKFEITQNWKDKNLNIHNEDIHKDIYKRLNDLLLESSDNLELSGFATIQRMQEGVELKCHTDQDTDPSIRYATILYLNDEYSNGELFFKNIDLTLKPKKGSLIIFPGTEKYHHGVRSVGKGPTRYVLVGFIKEQNFYQNNKYQGNGEK